MASLGFHKAETFAAVLEHWDEKGTLGDLLARFPIPLISAYATRPCSSRIFRRTRKPGAAGPLGHMFRKHRGRFMVPTSCTSSMDRPNMPYTPLEIAQIGKAYLQRLGFTFRTACHPGRCRDSRLPAQPADASEPERVLLRYSIVKREAASRRTLRQETEIGPAVSALTAVRYQPPRFRSTALSLLGLSGRLDRVSACCSIAVRVTVDAASAATSIRLSVAVVVVFVRPFGVVGRDRARLAWSTERLSGSPGLCRARTDLMLEQSAQRPAFLRAAGCFFLVDIIPYFVIHTRDAFTGRTIRG